MLFQLLISFALLVDVNANLHDNQPDDKEFSYALQTAIDSNDDVKIGNGTLILSKYPQELRCATLTSLNDLVISGSGNTVIFGQSETGADVLQLNRVTDITIKNLIIKSEITGKPKNGCNGISLTNGSSNVNIENVRVESLPYILTNFYNGGKGFTVQSGDSTAFNVSIINCEVVNCPYGISLDTKSVIHRVHILNNRFTDCLAGIVPSSSVNLETEINIIGNTFSNVKHPFLSGRMSATFVDNKVYISKDLTSFKDLWSRDNPFILLSAKNVIMTNNSLFKVNAGDWLHNDKSTVTFEDNILTGK